VDAREKAPRCAHRGASLPMADPPSAGGSEAAEEQVQKLSDKTDQTGDQTHVFIPSSCLPRGFLCGAKQTVERLVLLSGQPK